MKRFKMLNKKGQSTTEVVLIVPVLLLILFFTAKTFALLVMVQKLEIAGYYAARRWQLESHIGTSYQSWDRGLRRNIKGRVKEYLGFNKPIAKFLQLYDCQLDIDRSQTWNIVKLSVKMRPANIPILCKYPSNVVCADYGLACFKGYNYMCVSGAELEVKNYVSNRDRILDYHLLGLGKK